MERDNTFTATQTDEGFKVIFGDSAKTPVELTFDDINKFAYRYSQAQMSGSDLKMTEKEELMLSIWEMVLIPDKTIH